MDPRSELLRRAKEYAMRRGFLIREQLGFGVHSTVFVVESKGDSWAVKMHETEVGYARERDVYLRLRTLGIDSIRGCNVPEFLHHDDEFRAIEMSIVCVAEQRVAVGLRTSGFPPLRKGEWWAGDYLRRFRFPCSRAGCRRGRRRLRTLYREAALIAHFRRAVDFSLKTTPPPMHKSCKLGETNNTCRCRS
jgi:hypothetical protein